LFLGWPLPPPLPSLLSREYVGPRVSKKRKYGLLVPPTSTSSPTLSWPYGDHDTSRLI
jgi:hypothetical protein